MLRRVLLIAAVVALAALSGCRKPKQPSPYYEEASKNFNDLYADKLDDAYLDPKMDGIEDELKQVPKDSLDYEPAHLLIDRIDKGRAQQEALAKANAPKPQPPPPEPVFEDEAEEKPDAGPSEPVVGMAKQEFLARFSDCFQSKGSAVVREPDGGSADGEVYLLSDSADCKQRFPKFTTRLVITDSVKVIGTALVSTLATVPTDGGVPSASGADAG